MNEKLSKSSLNVRLIDCVEIFFYKEQEERAQNKH